MRLLILLSFLVTLGWLNHRWSGESDPPNLRAPKQAPAFSPKVPQPPPERGACPRKVTVAVLDTGIDYENPTLAKQLYVNPNEDDGNLDLDKNGFAGDLHGWDFVADNNRPFDPHGHGTHIAGIILGLSTDPHMDVKVPNFRLPCTPDIKVLPIRTWAPHLPDSMYIPIVVKAIKYAVAAKVDIINYSGGGEEPSEAELRAVAAAKKAGILIVASSGNNGTDSEKKRWYPASYPHNNVVSVAGTAAPTELADTSNFGIHVHVAAPGTNIVSTLPEVKWGAMTGTSQAAAAVSRLSAVLLSVNPKLTYRDVRKIIFETSMPLRHVTKKLGYGIVDPKAAIEMALKFN